MNIIYLHQHFACNKGVSGVRSYEFSKRFIQEGHKVELISGYYNYIGLNLDLKKHKKKIINIDGINLHLLPVFYAQKMSYFRRVLSFAKFSFLSTKEAMSCRNPDIIFASSTPLTISIPAMIASKYHKIPFIFEVRDLWPDIPIKLGIIKNKGIIKLLFFLEKLVYRRAQHIIALSPAMKEKIITKGINPDKISIISNSSDINLFRVPKEVGQNWRNSHPEIGNKSLLVYAGAFGYINGLDYVIKLAEYAKNIYPELLFLLIGDGSEKEKIIKLAQERKVLNYNLFIKDPVPREKLPEILSASTVVSSFVLNYPILFDNSANKLFDGFAAGKPIVINYSGWQANLLEETGAGIVLDPINIEKAAQILVNFISNNEKLEISAKASEKCADNLFNRDKLFKELEIIFLQVIENFNKKKK